MLRVYFKRPTDGTDPNYQSYPYDFDGQTKFVKARESPNDDDEFNFIKNAKFSKPSSWKIAERYYTDVFEIWTYDIYKAITKKDLTDEDIQKLGFILGPKNYDSREILDYLVKLLHENDRFFADKKLEISTKIH